MGDVLQVLKKDCVAALRRIFKLCDTNKDGLLDAGELNEFQVSYHENNFTSEADMVDMMIAEMLRHPTAGTRT